MSKTFKKNKKRIITQPNSQPNNSFFNNTHNDFSVVPGCPTPPGTNPQTNIGILRNILHEFVTDSVAVTGHAGNVSKHHANNHGFVRILRVFRNSTQGGLKGRHEFSIRGTQTQNVGPNLGPTQNLSHFFRKPIVVTLLVLVIGTRKGI